MPYADVGNGVNLFYEELGSGDKYVLCTQVGHGQYSLERELAKRGFHVFLLTNRGFGRSTHVTEDHGDRWYDVFADDVIAFADSMGIDKFVYSGASHGAGTGWHIALRYPERLHCFFAVVPGPHNIDEGKKSLRAMQLEGTSPQRHCFRYPRDEEAIKERWRIAKEAERAARAEPDYDAVHNSAETRAIDYGRPLSRLGTEEDLQAALSTITVPVLIIGGVEDTISRPDLMVRSAKCLPNCKLVIHSRVGHDMCLCEDAATDAVRFYENVMRTGNYYDEIVNG